MSTTGLTGSTDFIGADGLLKYRYAPLVNKLIVGDSETWDLFTKEEDFETVPGSDGKGIQITHLLNQGGGAAFLGEDGYYIAPSLAVTKQSSITVKQLGASCELSGRAMRRMKDSDAAVADWATQAMPAIVDRVLHLCDRTLIGPGTGIIARVNEGTPATTGTGVDTPYGIASLSGALKLFMDGDTLRAAAGSGYTTVRTGAMVTTGQLWGTTQLTLDALATSLADNDFIFAGDANLLTPSVQEPMGLEGHVDDGTNVATYQGLSRTTYPKLKSQILDSTTNGLGGVLSEDTVEYGMRLAWERGKGVPNVLLCSRSGAAAYWKSLKPDRRFNDPAGSYKGGFSKGGLQFLTDSGEILTLRACRKVPDERAYLIEKAALKMYETTPGHWDDTDGSIWNRTVNSTGRRDAFFACYVKEFETAGGAPNHHVKITSLVAA